MKNIQNIFQRLGFILGFLAVIVYALAIGLNTTSKDFDSFVNILQIMGGVLVGIAIILLAIHYRKNIWLFMTSRQARYGTNATILSISFIAIICLLNYISSRHHVRFDLTEAKQFSLSDQTVKILRNLDKEIKITAFFVENPHAPSDIQRRQQAKDAFSNYTYIKPDKIKVEFVDPEKEPVRAMKAQINANGTIIFESGGKKKIITTNEEQDLTGAILSVIKEQVPKVYFLEGHGEYGINSYDQQKGIGKIKPIIERELYKIESLNLLTAEIDINKITVDKTIKPSATVKDIPKDCTVLIIPGPAKPFLAQERTAITKYLDNGGKLLAMFIFNTQTGLESILAKYGITTKNDIVVDSRQRMGGGGNPVIADFPYHDITKNFVNMGVVFPLTRTVKMEEKLPTGVIGNTLLRTSGFSWAETDLKSNEVKFDDGSDTKGPISVGVAAIVDIEQFNKPSSSPSPSPSPSTETEKKKAKIVVFGTSNFISNVFASIGGNVDLFMNSLNWLAGEEQLISIRPKTPEQRQINLDNVTLSRIFWFTIVIVPAIILAIGAFIWWQRR